MIKTNLRLYSQAPARAVSQFVDMTAKTGVPGPSARGGGGGGEIVAFIQPLSHPVRAGGDSFLS